MRMRVRLMRCLPGKREGQAMKLWNVYFGWSRNVALGLIWTPEGKWALLCLGLCIANTGIRPTKSEKKP